MPTTSKIDAAYETEGNPLDDIARAEFRRGADWQRGEILDLAAELLDRGGTLEELRQKVEGQ